MRVPKIGARGARLLLASCLLTLLFGVSGFGETLEIAGKRLRLNDEDWSQKIVGKLRWRGGLELSGSHFGFGGLSGLTLSSDGTFLTAVTDKGRWLTAHLQWDAGQLAGIEAVGFGRLRDGQGRLYQRKRHQDAEALALDPDGALLVAFEQNHRVARYPVLGGPAEALPGDGRIEELDGNSGIEALVTLGDGRLLALTETPVEDDSPDYLAFWLADGLWHPLVLESRPGFRPTGATGLPNGDLLVLTRHFTILGGLRARLLRIAAADLAAAIETGGRLGGTEVALFEPPLTLDNFEGIAAFRGPADETLVALVSDDNFQPLQRNLLMVFELVD